MMRSDLFTAVNVAIKDTNVDRKISRVNNIVDKFANGMLKVDTGKISHQPEPITDAGRPEKPILVSPKELPKRKITNNYGKAALMHAIAHIEFNAINLALDAVYRFPDMPDKYYKDWLQVAKEECEHFLLARKYLHNLNYDYGSFPAHNGLWQMAMLTADDVLIRMALVPRVLEARGLDVTPAIISKFQNAQDQEAISVLQVIEKEEVGHVAIGSYWFKHLCRKRQLPALATFQKIIMQYAKSYIKLPLAKAKRLQAGFCGEELAILEGIVKT